MGHQTHALFLDLVRQLDPALATRLHDESNYRPFTVSPLSGGRLEGASLVLRHGQCCRLRFTLLDGGPLWQILIGIIQPKRITLKAPYFDLNITSVY
jgi:hypothetical protein